MFEVVQNRVVWRKRDQLLWVEGYGKDGIRVRSTLLNEMPVKNWCIPETLESSSQAEVTGKEAKVVNGTLTARVSEDGIVNFYDTATNELVCGERPYTWMQPTPRVMKRRMGNLHRAQLHMRSFEDEHLYGMGQHKHGYLDQKGCAMLLEQQNSEVTIPFVVSSRGYGMIWHHPGTGRVEFAKNGTCWFADAAELIDYVVVHEDTYAGIMNRYAEITGFAPMMPKWAAGFWQSKLRYQSQEELLSIAREYKKRNLPLDVIVIDYFHWTRMGDYCFDPKYWPDPKGLVEELDKMGIKAMVSVWPTVNRDSVNFNTFRENNFLMRTKQGYNTLQSIQDTYGDENPMLHHVDTTNPAARKYVWSLIKKNYYDNGYRIFWLDAIEPEIQMESPHENTYFYIGDGEETANLYPVGQQKCFYEGMKGEGEEEIVTLCRSGFLGSQRYGAAIWSGDIDSSFDSLRVQIRAGLNMAMSGIVWWTTDIGGFNNGNIDDPAFHELMIRWFQYGVFCPLFRLHGLRHDNKNGDMGIQSGADNEIWSFGEEAYEIIKPLLFLRERMKPYILEGMKKAHEEGLPLMRPLFFDFGKDENCYKVEDQFLFGHDVLVAPVLYAGADKRDVYLPAGEKWQDVRSGEVYEGGQTITAQAPITSIPVYVRVGGEMDMKIFANED